MYKNLDLTRSTLHARPYTLDLTRSTYLLIAFPYWHKYQNALG